MSFFADSFGQTVVMHDEDRVVGVPDAERSEPVAHDREEGNENVVDDIDDVELPGAEIDPAFALVVLDQP